MDIKENERIDDLEYKGLKIIQNKEGFCFGMDAVLLSDFAKELKENSKVLDLGTGTGILGILLCGKTKLSKIYGIEIQEEVAEMAKRSVKLNNLEEKFEILNKDIKEIENIFEKLSMDVVITNPPYKIKDTGIKNGKETKILSRHETTANLEDFIKISAKLLKQYGEIYMVHRPERLVDILSLLRKYKIEPKVLKMVYPKKDKSPNLILIKGIKGAKPFLNVEKPLIIYNEDNSYTQEVLKIYNKR